MYEQQLDIQAGFEDGTISVEDLIPRPDEVFQPDGSLSDVSLETALQKAAHKLANAYLSPLDLMQEARSEIMDLLDNKYRIIDSSMFNPVDPQTIKSILAFRAKKQMLEALRQNSKQGIFDPEYHRLKRELAKARADAKQEAETSLFDDQLGEEINEEALGEASISDITVPDWEQPETDFTNMNDPLNWDSDMPHPMDLAEAQRPYKPEEDDCPDLLMEATKYQRFIKGAPEWSAMSPEQQTLWMNYLHVADSVEDLATMYRPCRKHQNNSESNSDCRACKDGIRKALAELDKLPKAKPAVARRMRIKAHNAKARRSLH